MQRRNIPRWRLFYNDITGDHEEVYVHDDDNISGGSVGSSQASETSGGHQVWASCSELGSGPCIPLGGRLLPPLPFKSAYPIDSITDSKKRKYGGAVFNAFMKTLSKKILLI